MEPSQLSACSRSSVFGRHKQSEFASFAFQAVLRVARSIELPVRSKRNTDTNMISHLNNGPLYE